MRICFDDFTLDTDAYTLVRDGADVAVEPQVFALIAHLVAARDRIISKDELIEAVWDGRIVSDATLTTRINAARRALGDDGQRQHMIRTFPRRGVRFVAEVKDEDAIQTTQPTMGRRPITVLPFANLSGDPDQQFFADGIAEDVAMGLSRLPEFVVISQVNDLANLGTGAALPEAPGQPVAGYVLKGSVRRAGGRVRVSIQLVDSETGVTFIARNFDRDFNDVFELQDEISVSVLATLEPAMSNAERGRAMRADTRHAGAWELYYRGMSHLFDRGEYAQPAETARARECFGKAMEIDPAFSRAHSGYAFSQFFLFVVEPSQAVIDDAFKAANRAIELDPHDTFAYSVLCSVNFRVGQTDAAVRAGMRALELNPNYPWAHGAMGVAMVSGGRAREGIEHLEKALGGGPGTPHLGPCMGQMAMAHVYIGEFEKAVGYAHRALAVPSTQYWANMALTSAHGHLGHSEDAAMAARGLLHRRPGLTLSSVRATKQIADAGYRDRLIEGLRKAGIPEK